MALQHLRSNTANKRPDPAAMAEGQLALNTANASPGLFYKDATGVLIKAGPVHIGATAPNATPAAGGHAGNSVGEAWLDTSGTNPLLKIYNGAAFVTVQPVASGTVVSTADTGSVTSTMILDGTILNADINASAAIVDTKLATIATGGKVSNSATTATNANTASAIVARDASGNFTAGTITAALTGAASSNVLKAGDTMTGALVHPLGAAATPSLTFTGDLNTGLFSPGADQVAISTNGAQRLAVDSAGVLSLGAGFTSTKFSNGHFTEGAVGNRHFTISSTSTNLTNGPANLHFVRDAAVSSHDIGSITASWWDGSALNRNGDVSIGADGAQATGSSPGRIVFRTTPTGSAASLERMRLDSSGRLGLGTSSPSSLLHLADAGNITVGTTTGTKIGTATTQKIGFYNATPVVQPAAVADATTAIDVITQLNDLLAKLRTLGIIAT